MCIVKLDLNNTKNLDFAIYSVVLSKKKEFTEEDIVSDIKSYQNIDDDILHMRIRTLLEKRVNSGLIRQNWNTFSPV